MSSILEVLIESSVRGIIIAAVIALVLWGMRIKSPAIRHRAWTGLLVVILLLPFLSVWAPRITIPLLPEKSGLQENQIQNPITESNPPSVALDSSTPTRIPPPGKAGKSFFASLDIFEIGGFLYLAGLGIFIARLLAGMALAYRLARITQRDGRGFYYSRFSVPLTMGLLRPRILLPMESRHWDAKKLDVVLVHEREHVHRRDPLVEWLALLNRSIYWFHPLAWWLCRKLAILAEQSCDEAVIAHGHDRGSYAGLLLELSRSVKQKGRLVTAWGSSIHGSVLALRIHRILNSGLSQSISRTRLVLMTVICAAAAFLPAVGEPSRAQAISLSQPGKTMPIPTMALPETVVAPPQSSRSGSSIPSAEILYQTGLDLLEKHKYKDARQAFETQINTYPDNDLTASSYLKIGDSFYDEGGDENLLKAEQHYKDFIIFFPAHPSAVDAQMKIIDINMKMIRQLRFDYKFLMRADEAISRFFMLFPDSDYVPVVMQYRDEVTREFESGRFSQINGNIVDPRSNPITQVSISVVDLESNEVLHSIRPDDQGYFVIRHAPVKRKIGLLFEKVGFKPYLDNGIDLYSAPLRITMHPDLIERIDIQGNKRIPEERIRYYINSYPRDIYKEKKLEFDLQELWKTDFFDDIQIQKRDGDTGKIVTFIVQEKLLIRSIEYEGNESFTESDILAAFKKNNVGLTVDSRFEYRNVRVAENVLKELMIQYGKPRGTVRIQIENVPPYYVRLQFILDENGN